MRTIFSRYFERNHSIFYKIMKYLYGEFKIDSCGGLEVVAFLNPSSCTTNKLSLCERVVTTCRVMLEADLFCKCTLLHVNHHKLVLM